MGMEACPGPMHHNHCFMDVFHVHLHAGGESVHPTLFAEESGAPDLSLECLYLFHLDLSNVPPYTDVCLCGEVCGTYSQFKYAITKAIKLHTTPEQGDKRIQSTQIH